MHFSNGDKCWNGPDRSLKVGISICMPFQVCRFKIQTLSVVYTLVQVRLRCGLSNELNDVDEPSRCEYVDATDSVFIFQKKNVVCHLLICTYLPLQVCGCIVDSCSLR